MNHGYIARFRRWVVVAIVVCCLLYLAGSVWSGLSEIQTELRSFQWSMLFAALTLTLINYALRFVKWHYLLGRLDVNDVLAERVTFVTLCI